MEKKKETHKTEPVLNGSFLCRMELRTFTFCMMQFCEVRNARDVIRENEEVKKRSGVSATIGKVD